MGIISKETWEAAVEAYYQPTPNIQWGLPKTYTHWVNAKQLELLKEYHKQIEEQLLYGEASIK